MTRPSLDLVTVGGGRPTVVTFGDIDREPTPSQVDRMVRMVERLGWLETAADSRIPCGSHIWNTIVEGVVNDTRLEGYGEGGAVVLRWLNEYEVRGARR